MNKNNFYIKKIGQRGKILIYLVDGSKIRSKLDKEFTNFGQHFRFPFIPKYEFWLDKEAVPNERRFFIDHLLIEWQLMNNGSSYSEALEKADRKERSERRKASNFKKESDKSLIKKIHCRKLKEINEISVWLVRGCLVRNFFDVEFTEGGHDLVYKYVPKNEVWLDNDVLMKERKYIILHELYERSLMEKGLKYIQAHKKASRLEWQCRNNKDRLENILKELGWS